MNFLRTNSIRAFALALAAFGLGAIHIPAVAGDQPAKDVKTEVKVEPKTGAPAAAYPLDTCIVSGRKLGQMGKPVDYVSNGRLVRFCCPKCIDDFKKDPSKYLSKIDDAQKAKQK